MKDYGTVPCKGCQAPMLWAVTVPNGKRMPLDPEPVELPDSGSVAGLFVLVEATKGKPMGGGILPDAQVGCRGAKKTDAGPLFVSHWATCPKAQQFRRAK